MQPATSVSARMLLARRLRCLREQAALSVEDLAARAGISAKRLHGIESGGIDAHLDDLDRFAQVLGVAIDALFAGKCPDASGR
uniref:Helix-turn-helix domain-containing protein n=1 Tax=Bosea sp. NBC_00436 TaxID=2969620 RepID=A0A9E7ZKI6_9HYPH